ncbi:hypothetical protein WA026_005448 [Henosepilachna vigintioctopunctata]|uniref:Peptidase S1 domain-containing protein n=1 Tax=Henosepilachna vigintioctopunctata TaxID=420089 RepID=A0AAW1U5H7_9CUCU
MIDFAPKIVVTLFILFIINDVSSADNRAATAEDINFRIVGGGAADIKEYPYQVSILRGEKHHCGGSIVNRFFILTAAHCTYNTPYSKFTVRAGSSYWSKEGQLKEVIAKFEHPSYISKIYHNDISILKLRKPLIFDDTVQPIKLADAKMPPIPDGTMATVTGWGRLEYEREAMSDKLMVVHVPMISRDTCEKSYESSVITKSMICAGYVEGGRDACIGDSGGPLTMDGIQIGIVSWGISCAGANSPGVYTSVMVMRDFINEITGK